MPTRLDQLLNDASSLAEQVRRERQKHSVQPEASVKLRSLEEQLARTWTAIRLARSPQADALDSGSGDLRRRPKWG